MSGIQVGRIGLVVALLAGASGAASAARAQASGTLQASATVIDDPVSRAVLAELPALLERSGTASLPLRSLIADERYIARTTVRLLEPKGARPTVRVEVVYLN